MTLKMKYFLTLCFCLYLNELLYTQNYKLESKPSWVKNIEFNNNFNELKQISKSGFYISFADYQINLDLNHSYVHEVTNVSSYSGVTEASQLIISFDSTYQKVKIHHLYIWRNGTKIDNSKNLNFEIINNESKLTEGIYSGKLSLYKNLDDIRKDDFIDFSYTIEGENPILNNEKYLLMPLADNNPVDEYSLRVIYSNNKNYRYRCTECDSTISIVESIDNNIKTIHLRRKNILSMEVEEYMPISKLPCSYFSLTSMNTWGEVNEWAKSIFLLPKIVNIDTLLNVVVANSESEEDKINKIIDFIQDEIRYMGIETGIGSHKPSSPEVIAKQRYGDCKDKSLLLVSMLKKIGIESSYPVLVSTVYGSDLSAMLPNNEIFDHCIVTFNHNGKRYWVDPTHTLQGGGFRNSVIHNYGKVLIVGASSDTLSVMEFTDTISKIKYRDDYYVKSFSEPAVLKMFSSRYGDEADVRRLQLERISKREISQLVTDELKLKFEKVNEQSEPTVNDDIRQNTINCNYSYSIEDFWKDGDKIGAKEFNNVYFFLFEPITIAQYFQIFNCSKRKYSFESPAKLDVEYTSVFHLHKDLLILDDSKFFDNSAFSFSDEIVQLSPNKIQITNRLKIKTQIIEANDYERICKEKDDILEHISKAIVFNKN